MKTSKFNILFESVMSELDLIQQEWDNEEIIESYPIAGNYFVDIVQITYNDKTFYGFNIYECDENNIKDYPAIYKSGTAKEIDSVDTAKEQAEEWIAEYEYDNDLNDDYEEDTCPECDIPLINDGECPNCGNIYK